MAESFFRGILPFIRRHLEGALAVREKIRISEETFHLLLAGVVGIIAGLTNRAFFASVEFVMRWVLHGSGDVVPIAHVLPPWQRVLIPTAGGLVAGLILYWGLRLIKNQSPSNILEVVVSGNGRLPIRTALVKGLSSLVSIGTGASIGREGSVVQLSATFSSKLGTIWNWPPYRLRLLVASGAAAGLSAAYNAPVAGAIFAAQIVLGNFSMNLFAPLVVASVVSTMVSSLVGARALGPAGRGDLLVVVLWPPVIAMLAGLGLPTAYRYWMAKEPERVSPLFSNAASHSSA